MKIFFANDNQCVKIMHQNRKFNYITLNLFLTIGQEQICIKIDVNN